MVSLEDRRAGHFTWDLAAFPQCRRRDLSTGRRSTRHPALPPARSLLSVHVAIMDLNIPALRPVGYPGSCSTDFLTRSLSEHSAIF